MSFQGNVAGIGLAEVLQSIGRGDKVGVLNLSTREVGARLGMKGGLVFLLPGADEDPDEWRMRCQLAWGDDPQPSLESKRREALARAARLEALYLLLEASNVHFQFVPGSLDAWDTGESRETSPWGPGIPVEYLLLEHARLSDEGGASEQGPVFAYDMPRSVDPSSRPEGERAFLSHCDGTRTLSEIGDRLGWTLTQTRSLLTGHLQRGSARLAQPYEILAQAQRELERGHTDRAATRLSGWTSRSEPGPLGQGERACLKLEWNAGRLGPALALMPRSAGRSLLRRMDLGEEDADAALERWDAFAQTHRTDTLALVRTFLWRRRSDAPYDGAAMSELLRQARASQDKGFELRARTLLRLVASHVPEKLSMRLELGARLMDSGLVEEGSRWLVDGARELIDSRQHEHALAPLRRILDADPSHREAHGLLIETHAHSARRRRRRAVAAVVVAVALAGAGAGVVRVRGERIHEQRLSEVTSNLDRPEMALGLLDSYFEGDDSDRIATIRTNLQRRIKDAAAAQRDNWLVRFEEVRQLCELGDPLLALSRAVEHPEPLDLPVDLGPWPSRIDLFNVLANHIASQCDELAQDGDTSVEDLHKEQRMVADLAEILARISERIDLDGADAFAFRMTELRDQLISRSALRAADRERRKHQENLAQQDQLLATARAHAAANDLQRSIASYERFFASAQGEEEAAALRSLYGPEAEKVQGQLAAYDQALLFAESGEHERAFQVLQPHMARMSDYLLPWRIESEPSGARVSTSLGDNRVTPFVIRSGFGERVKLTFQLDGHEPIELDIDRPGDRHVVLHRTPQSEWRTGHRVDSLPVPTGRDHVVADRSGRIARIDPSGASLWTRELRTLGGVARTPAFLGTRPGYLVVLTEDGEAWIIDAATGAAEGPWDAGSPPVEGPVNTRSGVSARFADGRIAVWESGPVPEVFVAEPTIPRGVEARAETSSSGGVEALRRSANQGTSLTSRWTGWVVEVHPKEFRAHHGERSFTARRDGEWTFVAWEDANTLLPEGRLWIADGAGLRSYLPPR